MITNSFNLLDNMDAAAGSIATVVASALALTALLEGQLIVGGLAVVLASACLAFLIYNWHPARIFMGDAGSLFLGFMLAVISLKLRTPVPHGASIVAVVLMVGPAVFDTTLVVISRVAHRRPIFIGGTDHTTHRLVLLGVPRAAVTAVLVGGTVASCTLGVLVAEGIVSPAIAVPVALVPAFAALVFFLRMGVYSGDSTGRGQLTIHPSRDWRYAPKTPRPAPSTPRRHPPGGTSVAQPVPTGRSAAAEQRSSTGQEITGVVTRPAQPALDPGREHRLRLVEEHPDADDRLEALGDQVEVGGLDDFVADDDELELPRSVRRCRPDARLSATGPR